MIFFGIESGDLGAFGPLAPPVADFSGTPLKGWYGLVVTFTDLSTGSPSSWDWDFGDGSPHSYVQNPVHTYLKAGYFTVTLIATNGGGPDTEVKTDYVLVKSGLDFRFLRTRASYGLQDASDGIHSIQAP